MIALHEHGINIVSVTFDGAPANLTMCTIVGCNLNTKSLWTYFFHLTTHEKITVFLHAYHSLKLLYNCLGDHKLLIDDNNDAIKWQYFTKLQDLQANEGLHLGNKLKLQHVQYYKQKMKVKFAAQIFSVSVADALHYFVELICRISTNSKICTNNKRSF